MRLSAYLFALTLAPITLMAPASAVIATKSPRLLAPTNPSGSAPFPSSTTSIQAPSPCAATLPNGNTPPGENPGPEHHGNGALWTVLWKETEGRVVFEPGGPGSVEPDGSFDSIATAFGSGLATTTGGATGAMLPTVLAGTRVKIGGIAGTGRDAPLFFVSPRQVNYQIPPDTVNGRFTSLTAVMARIGGADAQVTFAGAQGGPVSLDQVNLLVPRILIGRGVVEIMLTVDGKIANTVEANIR